MRRTGSTTPHRDRAARSPCVLRLPLSCITPLPPERHLQSCGAMRPSSWRHGRVVRITHNSSRCGSAQATVPLAPLWPKVRSEDNSPKAFHSEDIRNPPAQTPGMFQRQYGPILRPWPLRVRTPEQPASGRLFQDYLAQAYASTRGSAPALRTPVFGSMAMAAFEPNDHAPADCNL